MATDPNPKPLPVALRGALLDGKYRLDGQLGEGGMGAVYEAENVRVKKRVAVKLLHAEFASQPKVRERFLREARASAQIDHPNLVQVFDVGEHAGVPFLVMELLRGESLDEFIERTGPMPVESMFAILGPTLRGLEAAHKRGFIHRDLKPANIFLPLAADDTAASPKIVDFGIAAELHRETDLGATRTRSGMGTLLYMPLEQMRDASKATESSDIYAMGVTMYQMLTGALPYEATSQVDLAFRMNSEPPRPMEMFRPDLDPALVAVVKRCLARDPHDRYANVAELVEALRPLGLERNSVLPTPRAKVSAALDARGETDATSAPKSGIQPTMPQGLDPFATTTMARDSASADGSLAWSESVRSGTHSSVGSQPAPSRIPKRLLGVVALGLVATIFAIGYRVTHPEIAPSAGSPSASSADAPGALLKPTPAASAPSVATPSTPTWVRIDPPSHPVQLGLAADNDRGVALTPHDAIHAPERAFELMSTEVTWGELELWLASAHESLSDPNPLEGDRPAWLPSAADERAEYPVVGISYDAAVRFCRSLDARLPTEAEWEYAARGESLRALPENAAHAYDLVDQIGRVKTRAADSTSVGRATLYDLAGNAREWVVGAIEAGGGWQWVRGLPRGLSDSAQQVPSEAPLAFHAPVCGAALSQCPGDRETVLGRRMQVGFRCARDLESAR